MMARRESLPDLYILDALADDTEDLEHVLQVLNGDTALGWHRRWGRPFHREEIVEALVRLIKANQVRAAVLAPDGKWLDELLPTEIPPGDFDDAWFAMTPHGRLVHTNWDPGDLEDLTGGSERPG